MCNEIALAAARTGISEHWNIELEEKERKKERRTHNVQIRLQKWMTDTNDGMQLNYWTVKSLFAGELIMRTSWQLCVIRLTGHTNHPSSIFRTQDASYRKSCSFYCSILPGIISMNTNTKLFHANYSFNDNSLSSRLLDNVFEGSMKLTNTNILMKFCRKCKRFSLPVIK